MKTLVVTIHDLPPMPRNRSHRVANNMLIKTEMCREFEKDLTERLKEFANGFGSFKADCSDSNFIRATYTIFTPRSHLFTKEGRISLRGVDTDAHKVLRDVLYRSIGIDDKLERDTRFYTPVSPDENWNYQIELFLEPIETLSESRHGYEEFREYPSKDDGDLL
jgi:hypothetical protein